MRKRLAGSFLVSFATLILACGCQPPPALTEAAPPAPTATVEIVAFTLRNDSSATVCVFYLFPATSETRGDDLLGGEPVAPGDARTFGVPAGDYALSAYDCEDNLLAAQEGIDLHRSVEWMLDDALLAGSLDAAEEPGSGEVELATGFAPDPYVVDLVGGGDVDVALLDLGADCTGYASSAPDLRIILWQDSDRLRIFFVADEDENAVLIISDPDENWLCNDDYADGGLDPMVEIEDAVGGQYDVWIGGQSADEVVGGALYVTTLDYSPDHLP